MNIETLEERINNLIKKVDEFIDDHHDCDRNHNDEHQKIWIELSALKVKASVWGALGGIMAVLVSVGTALAVKFFSGE